MISVSVNRIAARKPLAVKLALTLYPRAHQTIEQYNTNSAIPRARLQIEAREATGSAASAAATVDASYSSQPASQPAPNLKRLRVSK